MSQNKLILAVFILAVSGFTSINLAATPYDQVMQRIDQIALSNPAQVQVFTMGTNNQGQPIKGLKVGQGAVAALVVATHHGNEYGSTATALAVAESLAKNPIAQLSVYVIPVLNISGYNRSDRYEQLTSAKVIDANRDYSGPCVRTKTFQLKSTESLAKFIDEKNIVISATLHTYWPAVLYPWGISSTDLSTPHENQFKELVSFAAQDSHYQTGNNTQVLYPADGTFEDYAYWKHGIWSLLFELGFTHNPDPTAIKNMVDANVPGVRRFLEKAPRTRAPTHEFSGHCDSRKPMRVFLE